MAAKTVTKKSQVKKSYEVKCTASKIMAVSRIAIKIRDNYYTVEYTEERTVPEIPDVDMEKEREALWNDVNTTVDKQADEILTTFRK